MRWIARSIPRCTLTVVGLLLLTAWYVSLRWTVDFTFTDRCRVSLVAGCVQWERASAGYYSSVDVLHAQRERLRYSPSWNPVGHRPWGSWTAHRVALWALAPLPTAAMVISWLLWLRQQPLRAQLAKARRPAAITLTAFCGCTIAASIGLFVVSIWWSLGYWGSDLTNLWVVELRQGAISVSRSCWGFSTGPALPTGWVLEWRSGADWVHIPSLHVDRTTPMGWSGSVDVPCWLIAITAGVLTVWIARRFDKASKADCCGTCRYPRAGLLPDAPCPECGHSPPPQKR